MRINIYYGGRGIMGDPTLFVLSKMQSVFDELNVKTERYDLHDEKRNIISLPSTLNDVDGVILATTVEWYGVGGYMAEFLDACWFYGNKEKISNIYMCPIVMSTTYGERQGQLTLESAWDMLGGKTICGLTGYVKDSISFEMNTNYISTIEKTAENFYRNVSRRAQVLPASNQEVKAMVAASEVIKFTPQETEQLSKYASDENYVQTQKEDIKHLTDHFKSLLKYDGLGEEDAAIDKFKKRFAGKKGADVSYKFEVKEFNKPISVEIKDTTLSCTNIPLESPQVVCHISKDKLMSILEGDGTFREAFMAGDMQVKGDFAMLKELDELFPAAAEPLKMV